MRRTLSLTVALVLALAAPAAAQGPFAPLNDLLALGQGEGQLPDRLPTLTRPEPPLEATPRAECGPGAKPEPDIQGRVPAGTATDGFRCNLEQIGHHGNSGGFKVHRYVDKAGRECAIYDTALLFPVNALKLAGDSLGVAVLDMSDPTNPKQTATLLEPPMLSPHESLEVNDERGLIAAVLGNPGTYPGMVSVYDASEDCRTPVLQSSEVVARLGHESGFTKDGKTFYATSVAFNNVTAVDVTDPKRMTPVWQGQVNSHGMSLNADGTRAYVAASDGQLTILDTSEIQARKENPQAKEIARLTWERASIPQNAIPFTSGGKPYLLETDEYTQGTTGGGNRDNVGAARIIDISDETQPQVVANLRLQVNEPDDHAKASGDPGALSPVQGYAAHYCDVSAKVDPTVVACSFIASGLRVFDISKITEPKELGYWVAPTVARAENGLDGSNYAMSKPEIIPDRKEIWYSDGTSGFYALRVADAAWPARVAGPPVTLGPRRCRSRRDFRVRVRLPRGARATRVRATLAGRRVKAFKQRGRYVRLRADLRGLPKRKVRLKVRVTLADGRVVRDRRTYRTCTRKR